MSVEFAFFLHGCQTELARYKNILIEPNTKIHLTKLCSDDDQHDFESDRWNFLTHTAVLPCVS